MHELGVVFQVIKMVEEVCEENDLTEISSVTLELGEVSTVIEKYLYDVWKWAELNTDIIDSFCTICTSFKAKLKEQCRIRIVC